MDDNSLELSSRPLLIGILIWVLAAFLAYLCHYPPAPLPTTADSKLFSAMRADAHLKTLVADGIPHPAGSQQNAIVRQRVVEILESFGFQPELQAAVATPVVRRKDEVSITNIIARLPGNGRYKQNDRHAIALVSHYDSHPAGPGASDDGVGTAALLEVARMLRQQSEKNKFDRDIIFLITDGEEYGLLGAKAFVDSHPLANEIAAIVNIEARGSSGASLMFQTGSNSRWLVQQFAQVCERPRTSSLFYEVYRRMPNDTDFTIFDRAGVQGYNFAFIGDVANYHTPRDNYENADRGSLQHHGQNALGLIARLANLDIESQPSGRAVYFDVAGRWLVWWPDYLSAVLSFISFASLVFVGLICVRARSTSRRGLFVGMGVVLLSVLMIAGAGVLISIGLSFDNRFEKAWPDSPFPLGLAFWLTAIAIIGLLTSLTNMRRGFVKVSFGVMALWCTLAIASSFFLNGGSYLFVLPAMFVCVTSAIAVALSRKPGKHAFRAVPILLTLLVAGLVWFPTDFLFYDAIGFQSYLLPVIRTAVVATLMLPLFYLAETNFRMFVSGAFFGGAVLSLVWAVMTNS